MTHDQAKELRRLVQSHAAPPMPLPGQRPTMVVLSGGKGGVGTTTLAVNLAIVAARAGTKTVLVDADPDGGNVALLCGLEDRYTLADVLAGRRPITEALQQAIDQRLRILPGVWGLERLSDFTAAQCDHLLAQLAGLGTDADLVVVDAGNRPDSMAKKLWQAADRILVVATPDTASIIDAYASIKLLAGSQSTRPIQTLVNLAAEPEVVTNVHGRIARACKRFLGVELQMAGCVPEDPLAAVAGRRGEPFMVAAPGCDARPHLERIVAGFTRPHERTEKTEEVANSAKSEKSTQPNAA